MYQQCCEEMKEHLRGGEVAIEFLGKFREYGISYLDGGSSIQTIRYCPWCGAQLPASLRERWFDEIERLGLEPGDANIPEKYLTERWYLEDDAE